MRSEHNVVALKQVRVHLRLSLEHIQTGIRIQPSRNARATAASSTTGPRAVLIRIAVGFIIRNSGSPIR